MSVLSREERVRVVHAFVERQNRTTRVHIRRMMRLADTFSKKHGNRRRDRAALRLLQPRARA